VDRKYVVRLPDEQAVFQHFLDSIRNIRVDESRGSPSPYKPMVLYVVLEGIGNGTISANQIPFSYIREHFQQLARDHEINAEAQQAAYAYYHLKNDLLWMLCYKNPLQRIQPPASVQSIEQLVDCATLQDRYWHVLKGHPERCREAQSILQSRFADGTRRHSFWWVNQGQTWSQESEGSFIWAPQQNDQGQSFYHWENVGRVRRGDIIFHYNDGQIRAVSTAVQDAYDAPKPVSFPESRWNDLGRRSDLHFEYLSREIPRDHIAPAIRDLQLPYSPINGSGTVNQGYLFELNDAAAREIAQHIQLEGLSPALADVFRRLLGSQPVPPTPLRSRTTPMDNVILYGPPGTGKTFHTSQLAVELCDGRAEMDNELVQRRYRQLIDEGRVAFVTFHQSYGYEEFVEGIRPVLVSDDDRTETENISYECRAGVFKRLCLLAKATRSSRRETANIDLDDIAIWKMSLGDSNDPSEDRVYDEAIENGFLLLGYGDGLDYTNCDNRDEVLARLRTKKEAESNDYAVTAVNALKNQMSVGDLVIVSEGLTKFRAIGLVEGEYQFLGREYYPQARRVKWLAVFDESLPTETIMGQQFSQATIYQINRSKLKLDALRQLIARDPDDRQEAPRFVLVIDEINRGNISKILGELITLIESDKRLGRNSHPTGASRLEYKELRRVLAV